MYLQNMSEKIARSVRSNLRRGLVALNPRDQSLENFNVQNKSKIFAISTLALGSLPSKLLSWQTTTKCFAVKTLLHIQQTQCNTRQHTAHSFSGATIL